MPKFSFNPKIYPASPGCYLMKDRAGKILYVGKSVNLRSRLSSYFSPALKNGITRAMVRQIAEIEVILVFTETESLLLENNLIHLHRPPYNRLLGRGEKGFPYIALTQEAFPRLIRYQHGKPTEGVEADHIDRLYGPYISHPFITILLDYVMDHFQLRTCAYLPKACCLRYHLHQCSAPCIGKVSHEQYQEQVVQAHEFLSKDLHADYIRGMRQQMHLLAEQLEFERAQRLKEQIELIEKALEKQMVERVVDYDQAAVYFGERKALVADYRRGSLFGLLEIDVQSGPPLQPLLHLFQETSPEEVIVNLPDQADALEHVMRTNRLAETIVVCMQTEADQELMRLLELNETYRSSLP
jgi:excinuclease ABC subunit C